MKRFFLAALLLFAAVAFTGCDNDDDDLYDTLSGRVWAGDLGFYQDGRIPLDSYVYFGADGFGTDELRYADTGRYLDTLNIQWDAYDDDTIYIDYGRVDSPRELRRVHIRRGTLTGSRSTCSNTAAPNYIYNAPRILAESGERFYGTAGAIPAAGGSGPRYPDMARPCKQGPEYDFGALFITYLSGSPHSTAQGTRTIICRAIS